MIDVGYCTLCDAPLAVDALTCAACGGEVRQRMIRTKANSSARLNTVIKIWV